MLLMTKSLSFMRLMSMKLATFVLAIRIIISDVRSFFMVFTLVLLGFSFAFFTIINADNLSLHDDGQENVRSAASVLVSCTCPRSHPRRAQPFATLIEALFTMFNMGFLGDFDRDYFGSKPEVLWLFIFFVLIVIVIMLNVLIAIVSDSYGAHAPSPSIVCFLTRRKRR